MRQLDHPNIVKLVDFAESKQYYYIILELAPGGELFHQIVRLTYFSEDLSRHVITQVAKALEYLHEEKGVVHRFVPLIVPTNTTDVMTEISNQRICFFRQLNLFQLKIQGPEGQTMKTKSTKENSSRALVPVALASSKSPILV